MPRLPIQPTLQQSQFIKENYLTQEDEEMSKELGVTKTMVLKWRKRLGYTKEKPRKEVETSDYFTWGKSWPF